MNLVIVCTLGCTWAAYYLCNMQKSSKEKPTSFDDDGNGDGNSLAWNAAWSQNSIHNLIYRNIRADSFVGMSWRALTSLIGFSKMVSRTHSHCGFAQCSNWKFHCSACCFAYIYFQWVLCICVWICCLCLAGMLFIFFVFLVCLSSALPFAPHDFPLKYYYAFAVSFMLSFANSTHLLCMALYVYSHKMHSSCFTLNWHCSAIPAFSFSSPVCWYPTVFRIHFVIVVYIYYSRLKKK